MSIIRRMKLHSISNRRVVMVHCLVGLLTLGLLFATVHNRDTTTPDFGKGPEAAGRFDARWNDLSDHWREDGWWANGGMYYLNQCDWFKRAKGGSLSIWLGDQAEDSEAKPEDSEAKQYFYRSNTMLFLAPLHVAQSVTVQLAGGTSRPWVMVLYSQIITMMTAVLLGLSGTMLARNMKIRWGHALVLGLTSQIVLETTPINLDAYWGFYMQHAFALPLTGLLLSFIWPNPRARRWIRTTAVIGLFLADLPHAVLLIIGLALLNLVIDHRLFRYQRWGRSVLLPAAIGLAVIGIQYGIVLAGTDRHEFVGSSLFFRTGLDGGTKYFQSLWDGALGFIFESNLQPGAHAPATSRVLWIAGSIAAIGVLLIGTWQRRGSRLCYALAILAMAFIPFFLLFPNAVAIHPYAYPVIALPLTVLALFTALPLAMTIFARRSWPLVLLALLGGMTLTMANLRDYVIARPIDVESLLLKLPGLTSAQATDHLGGTPPTHESAAHFTVDAHISIDHGRDRTLSRNSAGPVNAVLHNSAT